MRRRSLSVKRLRHSAELLRRRSLPVKLRRHSRKRLRRFAVFSGLWRLDNSVSVRRIRRLASVKLRRRPLSGKLRRHSVFRRGLRRHSFSGLSRQHFDAAKRLEREKLFFGRIFQTGRRVFNADNRQRQEQQKRG